MQNKIVGAFEARKKFGDILETVGYRGENIVVEKNGRPLVAIVPLKVLALWEREREAVFEDMRRTAARVNTSDAEIDTIINETIQAVRTEKKKSVSTA